MIELKKTIAIIVAAACVILAIPVHSAWATDRINLGVTNPTAFEWDLLVAQDQGFFNKEDLDVRVVYMAPNLVINALLAGETQIAKSGTHFGIIAASRKADLKIVAGGLYGYPYDVVSQPEFKSLADLRGQKIVTGSQGSIVTVIFQDLMRKNGLTPRDYLMLVVSGSGTRFLALKSGQVAATVALAPPLNFSALDAGLKVLLHYNDIIKDLQYTSYFTTPGFASANRAQLNRFVRAIALSQRWLNDARNEKEAMRLLSRQLKIDESLAARTYRHMVTEGKAFRGEAKVDGAGLSEIIRMLAEANVIAQRAPWQSFILEP
jgi:ABC-type nitrate/sulfonate/bicarbonate transport system substrate-binding protein